MSEDIGLAEIAAGVESISTAISESLVTDAEEARDGTTANVADALYAIARALDRGATAQEAILNQLEYIVQKIGEEAG